jgi:cell wall-associated NlpC family hydrolase
MKFQTLTNKSLQAALIATALLSSVGFAQSIEDNQLSAPNSIGNSTVLNSSNAPTNTSSNTSVAAPVKPNFYGKVTTQLSESSSSLINNAMYLIGVRYRWGDKVQTGFDASAFVKYVLKDNLGFLFPVKTTDDMSKVGLQVSRESLKPGDLVFFNTLGSSHSHVGIYVGAGRFVHAPTTGGTVRIDEIRNPYWAIRYTEARRVLSP